MAVTFGDLWYSIGCPVFDANSMVESADFFPIEGLNLALILHLTMFVDFSTFSLNSLAVPSIDAFAMKINLEIILNEKIHSKLKKMNKYLP